jgi:hypothetical protein
MILLEKLKKVFKRLKRNPVEDVYFESPAFLRRWHEFLMKSKWVRGGILVAILVILAWGAYLLAYKIEAPQDLSELLPADSTIAYVEISTQQYETMMSTGETPSWWGNLPFSGLIVEPEPVSVDIFPIYPDGPPPASVTEEPTINARTEFVETGLGDRVGIAWIYNNDFIEEWKFYEVTDQTKALETLNFANMDESMPYAFIGDYFVTGGGTLLLDKIGAVFKGEEPSLKKDENFMKLRPSLPYDSAVFFYAKPAKLETWLKWGWNLDIETLGATFPKAAISLQALSHSFALFPAMGAVVDPDGTSTRIQTYWVGEKALIGDGTESFFHNDKKYKGNLLNYFPDTITQFWGGQNVAGGSGPGFVHQLSYVLDAADGVSGSALEQWMNKKITLWFGEEIARDAREQNTDAPDFLTLFGRESALGFFQPDPVCTFNPETDTEQVCTESTPAYILALEIDNDERGARGLVTTLFEKLLTRGYLEINKETSTLSVSALTSHQAEEDDIFYTQIFKENGGLLCAFAVYDDLLFVATTDESLRAVIQTATGNQTSYVETATYLNVEKLLSSGDQIWAMQNQNSQIVSSFNGFDDGFGTVHFVTPISLE